MRVCFFTYNLFGLGGIQRVLSVVANSLCDDYEVFIQCYDNEADENRELYNLNSKIKVIFIKPCSGNYFRKVLRKFNQKTAVLEKINSKRIFDYSYLIPTEQDMYVKVIKEYKIDVAIGVGAFESYMLGSVAPVVNCKTIGWQHSSYKAYFETAGAHCWGMGNSVDRYLKQLDAYVVLNEYDGKQLWNKKGVKTKTIYNPKSFESDTVSKLNKKTFISAGRFIPLKGYDLLIEAFSKFAINNKEWNLEIYGTGPQYKELEKKIKDYHLEQRIKLLGFTNNIKEKMLNASCYVLSSRWEGMPMTVLESLELGLPVIAFDITAMRPLVQDGKEGIIVDAFDTAKLAEAMEKISESSLTRKAMGVAARDKAKLFAIDNIKKQWDQILKEKGENS